MTTLATDTTLAELLTACRSPAGRDCDTTHLVMADRLDDLERGEWAELVRVSVELGRVKGEQDIRHAVEAVPLRSPRPPRPLRCRCHLGSSSRRVARVAGAGGVGWVGFYGEGITSS